MPTHALSTDAPARVLTLKSDPPGWHSQLRPGPPIQSATNPGIISPYRPWGNPSVSRCRLIGLIKVEMFKART